MSKEYRIEHMTRDDLDVAVEWAAREGWNPGLHDAESFYQADPSGFFAGKLDDRIIAVGSAVVYDAHFAFCGFYIVDPAYRDQGYGLELTKARLAYVGDRNAGIDGVIPMLDKYERLGYQLAHNNARYSLVSPSLHASDCSFCLPIKSVDFQALCDYDEAHFPARREAFLRGWLHQPESLALAYVDQGIQGYGVIRTCRHGFKIGPLFADSPEIANKLFQALARYAGNESIYLDIPCNNPNALDLVKDYQMEKVFETARMYLKGMPDLPISEIYGITSFELG